ncbi:diacylglyceryl transferase [Aequorivita sp. F7]|nr:MAG: diacylglyceryl transferase [Aequorivita sp.]UCA55792.1 diacylglyceryl transferase [Aequorivita sp. F7]
MKKLKERWNIETNGQLFIILLVFAITGSSAAKLAAPLTDFFNITKEMGWYIYWPFRIFIILPIYKVLLVFFGWVFGEFDFFWNFAKKMLRSMGFKF